MEECADNEAPGRKAALEAAGCRVGTVAHMSRDRDKCHSHHPRHDGKEEGGARSTREDAG